MSFLKDILSMIGVLVSVALGSVALVISVRANRRAREAHEIALGRHRREEHDRRVAERADLLRRLARREARRAGSGSTSRTVTFDLEDDLDRRAADVLEKAGEAEMDGDQCHVHVDLVPVHVRRNGQGSFQ